MKMWQEGKYGRENGSGSDEMVWVCRENVR